MILLIFALGFVVGIFIESFANYGFALVGFLFLIATTIFLLLGFRDREQIKFFSRKFIIPIFFIAMAFGVLRMDFSIPKIFPLDYLIGNRTSIEGIIIDEPDVRENKIFLTVDVYIFKENSKKAEYKTKILVKTEPYLKFSYGDRIKAVGFLEKPESFEKDGGGEFDYPSYLAKSGIFYVMDNADITKISSGEGSWLKSGLFKIKGKFTEVIGKMIPEPESSLLSGLVVGGKQSLGKEWLDRFQKAGVMHVVVLSGYNITIVAESVIKFFGLFLSNILSLAIGAFAIILFAIMTGGSATVVRASVMALIVILSRVTGRKYLVTRALIIAGVLMIIHNPAIVAFDPSFQLSFMATIALIYVSPLIESRLKFLPEKWKIREVVVSTVATQIFVLPLLLHMTGQFSIVGLAVNLMILIFIPATMFFGFWAGVVGLISGVLALPVAYVAYVFLWYELGVVKVFSSLSFASISLPAISGMATIAIYVFMVSGLVWWHSRIGIKNKEL